MTVWLLIVVLWSSGWPEPDVAAYQTVSKAQCEKLADSFAAGEDMEKDANPYPLRDFYSVSCEMKTGGDKDQA